MRIVPARRFASNMEARVGAGPVALPEPHCWGLAPNTTFFREEGGQAPRLTTDAAVDVAMHNPPRNTRAFGRGELVKHLLKHSSAGGSGYDSESDPRQAEYVINWSIFQVRGHAPFPMVDPFKTYASGVRRHLAKESGVVPDVS